ncbi:TIGR01906 family membrane protein [Holzapfeliella sp. He02]|uniref:TIGR01906 family membrane protein n=1 Tax=Holzapfeliella saturejae TaxID=3082953 RepID=A0ABU8SH12_9LACO
MLAVKSWLKSLYAIIFSLASAVVSAIVLSFPLLYLFLKTTDITKITSFSAETIMENYVQLMWYLLWPFQNVLKMSDFPTSVNGAQHFADVKVLFLLALGVFIVFGLFYRLVVKDKLLSKSILILGMVMPLIVLPFAVLNFDTFFVIFHETLFSNKDWLFDPATDPIINVLPESFFAATFAIGLLIYELQLWFVTKKKAQLR